MGDAHPAIQPSSGALAGRTYPLINKARCRRAWLVCCLFVACCWLLAYLLLAAGLFVCCLLIACRSPACCLLRACCCLESPSA
ncbi:hypothetical protein CV751_25395 [Achromobacter ruhlandii]|nr:hypothetical protein CV751_25395 [Achromobacter ruhlandii]